MTITVNQKPAKKSGHPKARPPLLSLDQPGRLHVGELMALLGISHSTLYLGIKTTRYPKPDGIDGKRPYWKTGTIKAFLEA